MDQDVSEILTSSESRVAPSLVNPGNKQQLAHDICINCSYHHRLGVFDMYKHLGVSLFV